MKEEIIEKYKDYKLGFSNYKEEEFSVVEFSDPEELSLIISEIYSHECSMTKSGLNFLKEYYGLSALAELLIKGNGLDFDLRSKEVFLSWINLLENDVAEDINGNI